MQEQDKSVVEVGVPAEAKARNPTQDKAVAYTRWIFLGMFGVHRFWWGKWKTGLLMLMLPIVGLGLLVAGVGGALWQADQNALAEAATAGGIAIVGLLLIVGSSIWTLLDAVLIALWNRRP